MENKKQNVQRNCRGYGSTMAISTPFQYVSPEKLRIYQAALKIGAGALRKLNFSSSFTISENTNLNSYDFEIGNVPVDAITDVNADAITSINQSALPAIPTANLPASVVYNNQNNSFGAFYQELASLAAPGNPASGTIRFYVDSVSGNITAKDSAGTVYNMMKPAKAQLPTAAVYSDQSNNFGSFYQDLGPVSPYAISAPTSGTRRVFVNSKNNNTLSVMLSDGTVAPLENAAISIFDTGEWPGSTVIASDGSSTTGGTGLWDTTAVLGFSSSTNNVTQTDATGGGLQSTHWVPSAASNHTVAGLKTTSPLTSRQKNPTLNLHYFTDGTTSRNVYLGFSTVSTLPTNTVTVLAAIDSGILLGCQSGGNWKIFYNDGTNTAPTPIDTGIPAVAGLAADNPQPANSRITAVITGDEANNKWTWQIQGGAINSITTRAPGSLTNMNFFAQVENTASNNPGINLYDAKVTQNHW
jgi:hypothetical protein